ncbi:coiled-coil domain-containing protein 50 isoform X3 [Takifugu flavidus]|uniref:coiled-coil domain-containing protein 50 isoform X2 n=1 Tax=Takifugu flavidus TaxID=433684 RepID=UPI002544B94B|nr:coiled-coil domain-containing protein 50 isoform X2 [Takifugu flavidus]XP_056893227.1 coiled-coil domain-containing protein 50 isoform X3 [Takifugu flavidus]
MCRDFAVLEDHSLAYTLQEQEIESHLASNVNKSKLVQKDLQVAKKLQEEEDHWAKVQSQKQHTDLERQDNEIAKEIQEQLVRQAEQQRQQEEKDAAIARKLQEKEMKEERKRQKQLESNFEEEYFEDHGAARGPLDLDKHIRHRSTSPGQQDAPSSSLYDYPQDNHSKEPKRSRHPRQEPAPPHSRSRNHEHHLLDEGGWSSHGDPYSEQLLTSRGKRGDRYQNYEPAESGRSRSHWDEDAEKVVRRKEKPVRPPPPQSPRERDKGWDREYKQERGRDLEWERYLAKEQRRDREQNHRQAREPGRDGERPRERRHSGDRQRQKDRERDRARTRSRERELEDYRHSSSSSREARASWEEEGDDGERERSTRGRQRVHPSPEEVFEEEREATREVRDTQQGEGSSRKRSHTHPDNDAGRIVHRGSGAVVSKSEFGLDETTRGMKKLDLTDQELKDLEVARKIQEEEIKASKLHERAAQVAQDEEIARLIMEQEKKEYKKVREREKERERDRERAAMEKIAMERRRHEGDYRPHSEDVVRPRTRDEFEHQKNHNKPARPAQPRVHDYENVNPYGHLDHPPRAPTRPEAANKGAYYKR